MTAPSCWLVDEAWMGVHYGNPTITLQGNNAALNQSGIIAIGATDWTVFDHDAAVVGTGTMAVTVTTNSTQPKIIMRAQ